MILEKVHVTTGGGRGADRTVPKACCFYDVGRGTSQSTKRGRKMLVRKKKHHRKKEKTGLEDGS